MNNNFGLSPEELKLVLLAVNHFSQIEKCVIFGSRAMGNYKKGSDIDIAVFGKEIDSLQILRLSSMLNECFPIPFSSDVVHYDRLTHEPLKEHINKNGIVFYERPPLVSVLMTVYNREKYIAEAIESVLASSYAHFELIIVDDQSTDQSVEIARKYEQHDSRIKVYVNEKNLGQFQNRNKAATYANGKYIKYLDSDDLIYPHGLQVMVWAIEQFPEAAFAVSYPKPEDTTPYPIQLSPQQAYYEQFLESGVMDIGPSGIIFNRQRFAESGGFAESGYVGNDNEILFRLAQKHPIVKMPTSLVWWRRHDNQAIGAGITSNEYLFNHFKLILSFLKHQDCPLSETDQQKAIQRQKQHHARKLLALATKQKQPGLAYTAWRKSGLTFVELLKGLKAYK